MNTALRNARDAIARALSSSEVAEIVWPEVGDHFNWAHDWFDGFARDDERPALVVVEESGDTVTYTFADMVIGSDQVAALLTDRGVRPGDGVVVMLGNEVELWLVMLALIKVGAVIIPTAAAVTPHDLADRVQRGARAL